MHIKTGMFGLLVRLCVKPEVGISVLLFPVWYWVGLVLRGERSIQTLFLVTLAILVAFGSAHAYIKKRICLLIEDVYETGTRACQFCYFPSGINLSGLVSTFHSNFCNNNDSVLLPADSLKCIWGFKFNIDKVKPLIYRILLFGVQ